MNAPFKIWAQDKKYNFMCADKTINKYHMLYILYIPGFNSTKCKTDFAVFFFMEIS